MQAKRQIMWAAALTVILGGAARADLVVDSLTTGTYRLGEVSDFTTGTSGNYFEQTNGADALVRGVTTAASANSLVFNASASTFDVVTSTASSESTLDADSRAVGIADSNQQIFFHVTADATYSVVGSVAYTLTNTGIPGTYQQYGSVQFLDFTDGSSNFSVQSYNLNGSVTNTGAFPLQVSLIAGHSYYLNVESFSNSRSNFAIGSTAGTGSASVSFGAGAVPEPSSLALIAIGGAAGLGYAARRRLARA